MSYMRFMDHIWELWFHIWDLWHIYGNYGFKFETHGPYMKIMVSYMRLMALIWKIWFHIWDLWPYIWSHNLLIWDLWPMYENYGLIWGLWPIYENYGFIYVIYGFVYEMYGFRNEIYGPSMTANDFLDCSNQSLKTFEFHLRDGRGRYINLHNAHITFSIIFTLIIQITFNTHI